MRKGISKRIVSIISLLALLLMVPAVPVSSAGCTHPSVTRVYSYENSEMHSYDSKCDVCGQILKGWGYSGWLDHVFSGDRCRDCGYVRACQHVSGGREYSDLGTEGHSSYDVCTKCGLKYNTVKSSHSYEYGVWTPVSSSVHERTGTCVCGSTVTGRASHTFSGSVCSGCGFKRDTGTGTGPVTQASVTLTATGPGGTLGAAGGELVSETYPASYTVKAVCSGCTLEKIVYTMNGKTYRTTSDTVTITASGKSDFTSTTFTAYATGGIRATFTVNFKYVEKSTAYYMWNTYETAVIRSVTGPGVNRTLSYPMDIGNSYDAQANLTESQVKELVSLIGNAIPGEIYTIRYTRTIRVYTPASETLNGREIVYGYFDGNDPGAIEECLSGWAWGEGTKEAIRQAASSYLTFLVPEDESETVPDCTAYWIDMTTGRELYTTKDFKVTGKATSSSYAIVSISYSDWSGSSSYTYDHLEYWGDSSGTSSLETYSQAWYKESKELVVTFYCKSMKPDGGPGEDTAEVTVRAADSSTGKTLSGATVSLDGVTSGNPGTYSKVSPGSHTASASCPGYVPDGGSVTFTVSPGEKKQVTVFLRKVTGTLTVKVRDASTMAVIPGASVSAGNGRTGTSDSSGTVVFDGMPVGSFTCTAEKNGYSPGSASGTLTESAPSTTVTVFLMKKTEAGNIIVTVKDRSTGNPIEEADVGISAAPVSRHGVTDGYGYAEFGDVAYGTYSVIASKDGYEPGEGKVTVSARSPDGRVTVYLDKTPEYGKITVKVMTSDGNAVSGASVSGVYLSGVTGDGGTVSFEGVPYGEYSFTASKAGYSSGRGSGAVTPENRDVTVVIYVDRLDADMNVRAEINGTLYVGTDVYVTVYVTNPSDIGFTKASEPTVTCQAFDGSGQEFMQSVQSFVIPANETTMLWFMMTVPDTDAVRIETSLSMPSGYGAGSTKAHVVTYPVRPIPDRHARDAGLVTVVPDGFAYSRASKTTFEGDLKRSEGSESRRSWYTWTWDPGTGSFVKEIYSASITVTGVSEPDITAGTIYVRDGTWVTRSGYGLASYVTYSVSGNTGAVSDGKPLAEASFPEHGYLTGDGISETLERTGDGDFVLRRDPESPGERRMHPTPLWFPDGMYDTAYSVYNVWCPAGELGGCAVSSVVIDGDMYDDLYTG